MFAVANLLLYDISTTCDYFTWSYDLTAALLS